MQLMGKKLYQFPFTDWKFDSFPLAGSWEQNIQRTGKKMIALIFISVQFATGMIKHTKNFIYNIYIIRMYIK